MAKPTVEDLRKRLSEEDMTLNERLEILDKIEELEEEKGNIRPKPEDSDFECFGCGS